MNKVIHISIFQVRNIISAKYSISLVEQVNTNTVSIPFKAF